MTDPPVWGRPSPAAAQAGPLRAAAASADAGIRADGGDLAWCSVRAATVVGTRHRLAGQPGQDAWGWAVTASAGVVLAAADGVGSRAGSEAAAAAAVQASCRPGDDPPAARLASAHDAVAELASLEEVATTLAVAVVGADGQFEVARVGDSTAWVLEAGGWLELFAVPSEDGAVAVATWALPQPEAPVESAAGTLAPGAALVLVTDGVGDPLRDGPTTVAPGLAEGLAQPPTASALARLAGFSRQGCHDDRTIVALWYLEGLVAFV